MRCSGSLECDGLCGNCDELEKVVNRLGEFEDQAEQTVDAVPVVHGRWISWKEVFPKSVFNNIGRKKKCFCSYCGVLRDKDNYCPNCGAKMDGDGNG